MMEVALFEVRLCIDLDVFVVAFAQLEFRGCSYTMYVSIDFCFSSTQCELSKGQKAPGLV